MLSGTRWHSMMLRAVTSTGSARGKRFSLLAKSSRSLRKVAPIQYTEVIFELSLSLYHAHTSSWSQNGALRLQLYRRIFSDTQARRRPRVGGSTLGNNRNKMMTNWKGRTAVSTESAAGCDVGDRHVGG